jgi:hypothetical protein
MISPTGAKKKSGALSGSKGQLAIPLSSGTTQHASTTHYPYSTIRTEKMDSSGIDASNLDISKLTDRDKQELQQFIVNESQKARIQQCKALFFPLSPVPLSIPRCIVKGILPATYYLNPRSLFACQK